jgi:hypothetical protein
MLPEMCSFARGETDLRDRRDTGRRSGLLRAATGSGALSARLSVKKERPVCRRRLMQVGETAQAAAGPGGRRDGHQRRSKQRLEGRAESPTRSTQFETATRLAPQMAEGWFYLEPDAGLEGAARRIEEGSRPRDSNPRIRTSSDGLPEPDPESPAPVPV